jgi:dual specificity MAP kinase phosphatase
MKHLGLSLVEAYLLVRSRRLSVLIQPNMRLLYNLCGWEVRLAKERAGIVAVAGSKGGGGGGGGDGGGDDDDVVMNGIDDASGADTNIVIDGMNVGAEKIDRLRLELAKTLSWPYLAKEVHELNEKYLGFELFDHERFAMV